MGEFPNKATQFTSENQPEKNGRPPKTLTKVMQELKDSGYERVTASMVMEAYELLLGLDEEQLKETITDKSKPMLIRIVGSAMGSKKGADMLEKMLDRAHGKPKQTSELSGLNGEPLFDTKSMMVELASKITNLIDGKQTESTGSSETDSTDPV